MELSSHIIRPEIETKNLQMCTEARELQKRVEELDNLVYRFSHDFKGPLDSIKGLLQLFPEEQLDENGKRYLGLIAQSTQRLSNVVLDMIDGISVIKREANCHSLALSAIVTDALAMVRAYVPDNHMVDLQVELNVYSNFYSDAQLIQSIIQHLMVNSVIYYNPYVENPYARLEVLSKGDAIKIVVEDNGQGIKENIKEKIFDMFYRGSIRSKGTGLGLYVVKSAVEKLRGSLCMESEVNKGTRFEIWIPSAH